jgi:hypothetical protein
MDYYHVTQVAVCPVNDPHAAYACTGFAPDCTCPANYSCRSSSSKCQVGIGWRTGRPAFLLLGLALASDAG